MENFEMLKGVGKTTADKIRKAGYSTIDAIAEAKPAVLAKKVGIFPSVSKRIVNSAKMIVKARIKEEKMKEEAVSKLEKNRKEEKEKKAFKDIQKGKIPLSEAITSLLPEVLNKNEDLYEEIIEDTSEEVAKGIKESAEFKSEVLNAAMRNRNFRHRLVNRIAKNLCDDWL